MRHDIHEFVRSMSYDDRLTALVCSVIRTKQEALASAVYLVESANVMSFAMSTRERLKLVSKMHDVADELERSVMLRE